MPGVIDCDIHNAPRSEAALLDYMPAQWRERRAGGGRLDADVEARRETLGDRSYLGGEYPRATRRAARTDAWPPSGDPPASDLPFMRQQLLDRFEIAYGVLTPMLGAGEQLDLERGAALASAINDWQAAEWLEPEPRLRASINIAYEDGELSAREIHRMATDPRFVQILMLIRTAEPLGRRRYWKIYEAAVEHDLPLGIHYGGWGRGPITGVGYGSFYIEDTVGMATAFADQLTSLVCEGVFERFPTLRIVLIEGGIAWLAPLMWRLDRAWKLLRAEAPALTRLPSELIREHVWLTTQPIDEPPRAADFTAMLEQMAMSDHILFATDYPHWDFDAPDRALPRSVTGTQRDAIMADNARRLYRLDHGARRRVRSVVVARADEIAPGERKIVQIGGRSIGVFNLAGECFALRNRCPHQGGPLCDGVAFAPLRSAAPGDYERGAEGEVIRCPWHGWEFEIRTGRSWFDPERTRVRGYRARVQAEPPGDAETYPTRCQKGYVVVELER